MRKSKYPNLQKEIMEAGMTYKAAAKRITDASREHGFVLITGEYEPTDKLRHEVLRILEY